MTNSSNAASSMYAMSPHHTLSSPMRLAGHAILLLLMHTALCSGTFAFRLGISAYSSSSSRRLSSLSSLYQSNNDEYSQSEVREMEKLIVSLSKERTDASRRSRLSGILTEALAKPNGAPKRFTDLFDRTLIEVGDRVRSVALEKALQAEKLETGSGESGSVEESSLVSRVEENNVTPASSDTSPNEDDFMSGKTDEEKQVWALVDMMVQSKTIVKKANGELGSSSEFA